jgi:hypothetical protein
METFMAPINFDLWGNENKIRTSSSALLKVEIQSQYKPTTHALAVVYPQSMRK